MDAAIVKLNALADADGAAADNHRLAAGQGRRFVFLFVGAVIVGRNRLEFGGAGIHHLIDRAQVPLPPPFPDLFRQHIGQSANLPVGKAQPLGPIKEFRGQGFGQQPPLHSHNPLQGADKPGVNIGIPYQGGRRGVTAQGGQHCPQAQVVGGQQVLRMRRGPGIIRQFSVGGGGHRFP